MFWERDINLETLLEGFKWMNTGNPWCTQTLQITSLHMMDAHASLPFISLFLYSGCQNICDKQLEICDNPLDPLPN